MPRIAGIDIPNDKRVEVGLTYIYGIGLSRSHQILGRTNVNPDTRGRDLTEAEVARLRDVIGQDFVVEGDLRREVAMNIKRLLSGPQAPTEPARPRAAHQDERAHATRIQAYRGRQEALLG
jgi:ribosomal protein uS13